MGCGTTITTVLEFGAAVEKARGEQGAVGYTRGTRC